MTGDATTDQLDNLYQKWKLFARCNIIPEFRVRTPYASPAKEENDRAWIRFLNLGIVYGNHLHYSEDGELLSAGVLAEGSSYYNTSMIERILLPKAEDEGAVKANPYKGFHGNLRKYGIGRRLACSAVGYVGLVPGETAVGDEICTFINTQYPFILRKAPKGKHIVIGEACKCISKLNVL